MSNPTDDLASHEEHTNVDRSLMSALGSDPMTRSATDADYSTDDDLPDLVDDEGRRVDAAVTDGPEETREARTSFLTPLHHGGVTWSSLPPPPAFPEPLPLERLSEMQVSSPPCPDEEKEHLTDGEAPSPMESVSESSSSAQVTLRVTIDMDPNAQLYVYHLRLKPSAASYVGALVMMDRATFFAAAAPYRSGSPAETAGIVSSSWIEVYGPPSAIITERAPAFAADLQASMNLIADVEVKRPTSSLVLGGSLERQMCSLTRVLSSACNRDGWEETVLPKAMEAYNRGERVTTLAPTPLPSAAHRYPISLWYSKPSGRPARVPTRTRCRICFGRHLTTLCEEEVCEPTEAQRQSLMRYRAVLGIPWWKAMIALLIQDCETALEEEEFATACSTEGSTLPMICFEVRELPDEETPTPAYLNWTA